MKHTYRLKTETIKNDVGDIFTAYGIDIYNSKKELVKSVSDIFLDKRKAEKFVKICNDLEIPINRISDIIDYVIADQYIINP